MQSFMEIEKKYAAKNYNPLPVEIVYGEGMYLYDMVGKAYLDMMGAYSAASFGHRNPVIIEALKQQIDTLDVTSRAFFTSKLGPFLQKICEVTNMDSALPMNSGAEAVETALKAARGWGYNKKEIAEDKAEIIVCNNNFHGRTITITGFSSHESNKKGFGPFTPGFKSIPFGNLNALIEAINKNTVAFLLEPIQGEGGINVPPDGYLKNVEVICKEHNILLLLDEIQTGLGRTGYLLASEKENVHPDGIMLGKALGGGLYPVSCFAATQEVMESFTPGNHGSTFGGNPLAAAVGLKALSMFEDGSLLRHVNLMSSYFFEKLRGLNSPAIIDIRGRGLFIGLQFFREIPAGQVELKLLEHQILTKATHKNTIRLAPPLVITKKEIDKVVAAIQKICWELN